MNSIKPEEDGLFFLEREPFSIVRINNRKSLADRLKIVREIAAEVNLGKTRIETLNNRDNHCK